MSTGLSENSSIFSELQSAQSALLNAQNVLKTHAAQEAAVPAVPSHGQAPGLQGFEPPPGLTGATCHDYDDPHVQKEVAELSSMQNLRSALASWNVAYGGSLIGQGQESESRESAQVGEAQPALPDLSLRLGSRRGALRSQTILSNLGPKDPSGKRYRVARAKTRSSARQYLGEQVMPRLKAALALLELRR